MSSYKTDLCDICHHEVSEAELHDKADFIGAFTVVNSHGSNYSLDVCRDCGRRLSIEIANRIRELKGVI